jgi:hypothetical protein
MEYYSAIIHEPPARAGAECMARDPAPDDTLEPLPAALAQRLPWLRLLRVHHWLKNLLLGVPFLTAQAWTQPAAPGRLGLGFLAFSLLASATYVFNDLADVAFDRAHAAKRHRPLAAGTIAKLPAVAAAGLAGLAGLLAAWRVGGEFLGVLAAYVLLTTLYTRRLKRVGTMFTPFFAERPVTDFAAAKASDTRLHAAFFHTMLEAGVYLPPSQFEAAFTSAVHTAAEIETLAAGAARALAAAGFPAKHAAGGR